MQYSVCSVQVKESEWRELLPADTLDNLENQDNPDTLDTLDITITLDNPDNPDTLDNLGNPDTLDKLEANENQNTKTLNTRERLTYIQGSRTVVSPVALSRTLYISTHIIY